MPGSAGYRRTAMKLLALDTSSDACSVALQHDGRVSERHELQPKAHTQLLMPMIESLLEQADLKVRDLDAVVAGIGPGSFIGVRIAVSVAQGLAFAGGLKAVPVSSLAAVAAESFETGADRVAVAQDAHMQQVYFARFLRGKKSLPQPLAETALQDIGPIDCLAGDESGRWHAAGAGWRRYPDLMSQNSDRLAGVVEIAFPRARYLLPMAAAALRAGRAVAPALLEPAYVRQQVAREPAA